jgi:CubicO group peptidase (beta-lactamase class C family)
VSLRDALPAIDQLVADTAAEHHCPSIVWGLVVDGELAHVGSTGTVGDEADGTLRAPTEHTVYRIASMTKSFTAAAVLSLRDDGVLSLDDPIVRHAPELAVVAPSNDDAAPIRIRDLLSMAAGIATDDAWADRHLDITDDELDAALAGGILFAGQPGDTYEYSNLGYGLIGRIVKRATGQRVQDLISERFLGPLGMDRSTWVMPDHDDWARPFAEVDGRAVADDLPLGDGEIAPMGGIWTTLTDLSTWVAWLDDAFPARSGDDSGPLSRASRRELQQVHRYIGLAAVGERQIGTGYGYGLRVRDDARIGRVVTHSGGVPGYGSTMRWLSGTGFGCVALANITYAPMVTMGESMFELLADHHALPAPPTADTTLVERLGRRLVALLTDWDDAVADELFTDNIALDEPYERRRTAAREWIDACGGRLQIERVQASSLTSGELLIAHPSGTAVELDLQIAPLVPPRIQTFGIDLPDEASTDARADAAGDLRL